MIDGAQRKLREAQFFYRRLVDEREHPSANEPEAFRYYLSAFIGAARAITWAIGKEETEKYHAWRDTWEKTLTDEDRKFLILANELRLDDVKRGGADLIVESEEIAIYELWSESNAWWAVYNQHSAGPPGFSSATTVRPAYYREHEDGKVELTAMCKKYLEYLERLVGDFLKAHA